jgi:ubiquinone/menaquinone biosynthesis C-methylase UbiE
VATRAETDGEAVRHPIFARVFDRLSRKVEDRGQAEHRGELLAGLEGRVIEVGAGNGLNFAHYPASVAEVVAVEPEPYLRERAQEAAATARAAIRVVDGTAERLPAEAASFDAGVASLVLCSVADQAAALGELRRVIRPGGELRFYEHVRAGGPGMARAQRIADRTFWPYLAGGCHASRETAAAIAAAGFEIEACRSFRFAPSPLVALVAPHVLGVARRR